MTQGCKLKLHINTLLKQPCSLAVVREEQFLDLESLWFNLTTVFSSNGAVSYQGMFCHDNKQSAWSVFEILWHGHFYVACSLVTSSDSLVIVQPEGCTKNIFFMKWYESVCLCPARHAWQSHVAANSIKSLFHLDNLENKICMSNT